jgi:hypothetical protein
LIEVMLNDAGRPLRYELWFRGWSDRGGHWFDDNSLYRGSNNGRLIWEVAPHEATETIAINGITADRKSAISYDHWRQSQNQYLLKIISDSRQALAAFEQNLAIRDETAKLIMRENIHAQLSNWYSEWHRSNKHCVILGDEGDGKTWAVVHWLLSLASWNGPLRHFNLAHPPIH